VRRTAASAESVSLVDLEMMSMNLSVNMPQLPPRGPSDEPHRSPFVSLSKKCSGSLSPLSSTVRCRSQRRRRNEEREREREREREKEAGVVVWSTSHAREADC
jgi:hypothetical protein